MPSKTSNTNSDLYAAQKAIEEMAKAAKRGALQIEINSLESKLSNVNKQIDDLASEQKRLNIYLDEWTVQKSLYNSAFPEVVVVNVFEGVCADKMEDELTTCISEMDQTCKGIGGLNASVSSQILQLNQQASSICTRINALRNEKNSI